MLGSGFLAAVLALAWFGGTPRVAMAESTASSIANSAVSREAPQARWITHRVVPGQSTASIAARYGVTSADVERWNPRVVGGRLRSGWIVQVKAKADTVEVARPVLKAVHVVQPGETWESIAAQHGSSAQSLRLRAHAGGEAPPVGERIVVWREHGAEPWNPYQGRARSMAPVPAVRGGARSVGRTNDGSLHDGVALPDSSLYDCWRPANCYGSTHTVRTLVSAIAGFRAAIGWDGTLLVKSISRREGGHFPPHRSHRSGRDVDIQLPRLDGGDQRGREDQVDWHAAWTLIDSLIATGEVEVIFLAGRLHSFLRRAARDMGASPRQRATIGSVVRSWQGHHTHIHVRFRCGPQDVDCVGSHGAEDDAENDADHEDVAGATTDES